MPTETQSKNIPSAGARRAPNAPLLRLQDSTPFILPTDAHPGVPAFVPAVGLGNRHSQTMAGAFFPGRPAVMGTMQRQVALPDGDHVVLHDDRPESWKRGDNVALLLHGLCGSHRSGYMVRLANKLTRSRGARVFRLDHRGCGAGSGLARYPYHAGRIDDIAAVLQRIEHLCPGSPISIAGFSLSGNLLLRFLGQRPEDVPLSVFRAVAISPPVDLHGCVEHLSSTRTGLRYDLYFARRLVDHVAESPQWRDNVPLASMRRTPRRVVEFDELYTAPAAGFRDLDDYYTSAASRHVIGDIRVHTTILSAQDDPLVPANSIMQVRCPPNVTLCITQHGGHLGFIGRKGIDEDRRWMDWRVVDWLLN